MAVLFLDECSADSIVDNNDNKWNVGGSVPSVSSSYAFQSRYGWQFDSTHYGVSISKAFVASVDWFCFHIKWTTLPNVTQYLSKLEGSASLRARLRVTTDGSLWIGNNSGEEDTGFDFATGVWYQVSFYAPASGGANARVLVRDGLSGVTLEDHTYSGGTSGVHDTFFISAGTGNTFSHTIDNIVFASTTDPAVALNGKFSVIGLWPTGAGDINDFTGSYADVDENPNDNNTTYITTTTADAKFLAALEDMDGLGISLGEIAAMQLSNWIACSAASGGGYPMIKTLSTEYLGSAFAAVSSTITDFSWRSGVWLLNPNTSAAWQHSEVNALQGGTKKLSNANTYRDTAVYVEVLCGLSSLIAGAQIVSPL